MGNVVFLLFASFACIFKLTVEDNQKEGEHIFRDMIKLSELYFL